MALTLPSGDFNAASNLGTQGGTAGTGTLSNLQLLIGNNGTGNDFGVLLPASLSGYSYVDANGNGKFDSGETPLAGVSVALSGTDDLGNPVSQSATTAADGSYSFTGLRPGTYALSETAPTGYVAGTAAAGSQGAGTIAASSLSGISLSSGTSGTGNDFSSLLASQVVQTVDLTSDFNLTGITADGAHFTGGIDGVGNALSANLLGTSQVWNGVQFAIGAAGSNNVIQSTGQTITLPAGQYTQLDLLATAVQGNQVSQQFVVHYSDGSSTTFTQSISDWYVSQKYAGESIVDRTAHRNTAGGGSDGRSFDVYGYSFQLDPTKTVSSITLPDNKDVEVLAFSTVAAIDPPGGLATQTAFTLQTTQLGGGTGGIQLSWSAPSGNITGYNVYRGTTAGGESATPLNPTPLSATTTSYIDTTVVPGNTYYYIVRAINGPATSANSDEATASLADGTPDVQVDLSDNYNLVGITSDGTKTTGGLDGSGNTLSANLLGTTQTVGGVPYVIGAAGASNVVQATGQTISVPAGQYAELDLLATGVNGNQVAQKFTIHYSDGTSATVTENISDWFTPQNYSGESTAVSMAYRNLSGGGKDSRTFDVFGYRIALDDTKTIASITLPADKNVEVLAMTAIAAAPAPTGLQAAAGTGNEIDLSWTGSTGTATGYNVYRGTASGGESATPLNSTPLPASATGYQDTTALPGNTYYYVVRAVNGPVVGPASLETSFTATASATTQVDLTGAYNAVGIAANGSTFSGGLDGVGYALSSTLLGTSQTWNGQTFNVAAAGANNVVRATGQTVTLPAGQYSQIELLATAVDGNQVSQSFVVHYSDGSSQTITQSLSDWYSPQNYSGESTAVTMVYRNSAGGQTDNRDFYVYGYVFQVDNSKTVTSITLPANQHVDVVAIDAVP